MPIANWFPDPADPTRLRWWDGESWTEHTAARPDPAVAGGSPVASSGRHSSEAHPAPSAVTAPVPASPVQRFGDEVAVHAAAVTAGWAPTMCTQHHRPAVATRKVTFLSRLPGWTYLLILVAGLAFIIVASVIRKRAVAFAWPLCPECVATRRRNMILVAGGLGGIVPLLIVSNAIDNAHRFPDALAPLLSIVAFVLLPCLAAAGAILGAWTRIIGGVVSADGVWVVFPLGALPLPAALAQPAVGVASSGRVVLPS